MGWYRVTRDCDERFKFLVDSATDVESLPTDVPAGSKAMVADGTARYCYTPDAGWTQVLQGEIEELDPVFNASPAKDITEDDVELLHSNDETNITAASMEAFITAFNASGLGTITMTYDESNKVYAFTVVGPEENEPEA